jgi:hypothetical protein
LEVGSAGFQLDLLASDAEKVSLGKINELVQIAEPQRSFHRFFSYPPRDGRIRMMQKAQNRVRGDETFRDAVKFTSPFAVDWPGNPRKK